MSVRDEGGIAVAVVMSDVPSGAMALLNALAILPLTEWREIATKSPLTVSPELRRALERALERATTPFAVWQARDHLDTVMYRFRCMEGGDGAAQVREATERAILAMLARPALRAYEFDELVGGFSGFR